MKSVLISTLFVAFGVAANADPIRYSMSRACSDGVPTHDTVIDQGSGLTIDGQKITLVESFRDAGGPLCMSTAVGTIQNLQVDVTSGSMFCEDGSVTPTQNLPAQFTFQQMDGVYQFSVGGFGQDGTCSQNATLTYFFTPIQQTLKSKLSLH